jgi:hypothetical protein
MKLRELIRPQINEGIIPEGAKTWWAKYGKRITRLASAANIALLIQDAIELEDSINRLPKDKMTKEAYTASVLSLVGNMVAVNGLPETMFVLGGVIGGVFTAATGVGFFAGVGIGSILGLLVSFPVGWFYNDTLEDLVAWLVKKYYLGDENAFIRGPNDEHEPLGAPVNDAAAKFAQKQAIKMGLPDTSPTAERVLKMAKWYRAHPAEIK